ncbi:ABC-2 type transport system permease protein [Amycolatopsis arida]|uniref:ABC-2 type transport system permease protein n=1 Tax=Amycolatopsis arida TaxID=587909 RepID=A0A1I5PEA7_9PSEU|nr:ABC transporter permease subunit [Amycolatopsis arida]TDX98470.1 ABC-2 type transport system permease protein [Amycolatopsis arida]SFP32462.1 ABC-2 type transport system permease protein [Amycolatopsis arida]
MGRLIRAEFRKTLSLHTWWVLIIPLVVLSFGFSFVWGRITNDFVGYIGSGTAGELARAVGLDPDAFPVGLLSIAHGVNIATLVPLIFGVFALAGEYHSRTITTTFLTAPNRVSALSAKMIAYLVWGTLYGVLSFGVSALATLITVDSEGLPTGPQWLGAFGGTVLVSVLVTLFGIGFGAVLNKVTLAVVLLLIYFLAVENVLVLMLWDTTTVLGGILPNGTANGIVGGIAADAFGIDTLNLPGAVETWEQYGLQMAAGAPGVFSWWASALVFFCWTMVFFVAGWAANQRRDIT